MADISSITLPGGGTYDLKDKNAVPKYGMGKNLLDNWYFVGGGSQLGNGIFPINQRGQTNYSGSGYNIDRFRFIASGTSLSIGSDGITITDASSHRNWYIGGQVMENATRYAGHTLTLSALISSNVGDRIVPQIRLQNSGSYAYSYVATQTDSELYSKTVTIPNSGFNEMFVGLYHVNQSVSNESTVKIKAMKLEFGTEQTLAHKENDVWGLNEIPDYEEELIKCQTSTADSTDTYANKTLATEQQLAVIESGITASVQHDIGEFFCWNGFLYRATTNISANEEIKPGTNCEQKYATGMAVQWKDVSGTSGGSSAIDITNLTGLRPSNALILSVFDKNATVNAALSLVFYPSGDRYGAALVNKAGVNQASTAYNLRIMYVSI